MNTKEKLMQLLELCIEKKLNFEYSPKYGLISVREYDINSNILFERETWNLDNILSEIELNELITKVKKYRP